MKHPRLARPSVSSLLLAAAAFLFAACGGGGGGGGKPGPSAAQSSVTIGPVFGTPADGASTATVSVFIADKGGNGLAGIPVELRAGGYGTTLGQPVVTDAQGKTQGSIASSAAETKDVQVVVYPGAPNERVLIRADVTFVDVQPYARYVRAGGSDAADGRTPLTAWRTLAFAMTQVGPGNVLYVGAGTYAPFEISVAATSASPLVLRGDPEGRFTGDAGDVLIDAGGSDYGVRFAGASNVVLRGFSITNALPTAPARGGGIRFTQGQNDGCSILDCALYENTRGLDVGFAKNLVFENNSVSKNFGPGIALEASQNAQLVQSTIYANDAEGILMEGLQQNLFVGLCTLYQNGADQIHEAGAVASTGRLADNLVTEGGADALVLQPMSSFSVENNMSWANTGAELQLSAPNPVNIIADPLLVDPAGPDGLLGGPAAADDNFRLRSGSPALDAGDVAAPDSGLRFGGVMVNYSSLEDGTREAVGADGRTVNLGYHYPGELDATATSEPQGGRVAFVRPGEAVLRTAARDAAGSYATAIRARDVGSEAKWVVQALAPGRPDEWTATLSDTGTATRLDVRHWNGRIWTEGYGTPLTSQILPQNTGERGFDLAVESLSGDALLVRSDNSSNPLFRAYSAGTWSEDAPVFSPSLGTGVVLWVELVSDPNSDRIALVALDDTQHLTAAIWDGAAWTQPVLLDTQIVSLREFKPFDACFETQSGDLLVMWGFSVFAEQARFATLSPAGSWTFGLHPSTEAVGSTVKLAADPTTDRIMAVLGEGDSDDDVAVALWDGAAWSDTAEVTLNGVPRQHSLAAGWIGNTGRAVAVWREPGKPGSFMSARFDDFWKIEGARTIAGVGQALGVEIRAIPGTNQAEAVLVDDTGKLFSARIGWDGNDSTWQTTNGGAPIETGLDGTLPTRTFAFDLRQP